MQMDKSCLEYQVINGQIVKTNGADGANTTVTPTQLTTASNAASTTPKRSDLNNGQLPQTGNHSEAGLIGLGVAGLMGALGMTKRRRHS